ncbi:unnamed protein product [Urochloa decumbens]|uniref:BURP domain-containing protein n=1 Tax=Urochloa decumbens TaxID=240449 RepID=A0ABC8WBT8_9POAL
MHPSALLLIVLVAASAGAATCAAASTPAASFWEEILPGTPMPPTIAELVQKGTDLKEGSVHPQLQHQLVSCLGYKYENECGGPPTSSSSAAMGVFFRRDMRAPFANVSDVLATFAVAPGSAEASILRGTVRACEAPPLAGERKACATSLEGTLQAAARMLGTKRMSVAVSALTPSSGLPRQEYEVVAAVALLDGRRHVTCHNDPFPYAVYRCHMDKDYMMSTEAYVLTLRGLQQQHGSDVSSESSSLVDMVAVCHLDTSKWSPAHPAFKTLNLQPGAAPLCHFVPYADLLFSDKAEND